MEKIEYLMPSIIEQITTAMDGRKQRWLSFEIRVPESELSKKMKGHKEFSDKELQKIQERLNFKIKRPKIAKKPATNNKVLHSNNTHI